MNDPARPVFVALGFTLLVVIVVPLLVMMGTTTGGMDGMMDGRGIWYMGTLVLVVLLAGIALLASRMRRRQ